MQRLQWHGAERPLRDVGQYTLSGAMDAARRLLTAKNPPDGIFCANDIMAIGALNVAAGEMGMVPGRDISIIGFDDIAMAGWPLFNLTTYVQPMDDMVTSAVRILAAQLADADAPAVQQVLPGRLVVRGSARTPGPDADS